MIREAEIERYLVKQVKKLGGEAYKWVSPGNKGVPDRIVIFPGAPIQFVELKSYNGKLSSQQVRQLDKLDGLGCSTWVLNSKTAVNDFLRRYRD